MITIYHNNRCSKSRDGVCLLENSNVDFEVINYLENTPTEAELKEILKKLGVKAIEIVRQKENIWLENYKDKKMTEAQIIKALVKFPKLIERPIIINGDKAVIGRPIEKILEIL